MKPETNNRTMIATGSQDSTSFGISEKDTAHIMGILREGLYTDRILAVLREYSANAWDAHRSVGKGDVPIVVHVPTDDEPLFTVRDFGPGLSHDEMFQVFTQYGSSTKRDSNDVVGMLGIGSKSAFSYADTFTVISHNGGRVRTYVAALDASDKGTLVLLADTPSDETGLEIRVATRPGDAHEWEKKARRLFKHMTPRPEINIVLPDPPAEATRLEAGTIVNDDRGRWYAIMGCVPYRIDLDQLGDTVPACLREMSGVVNFTIGAVQMSASREELKYTQVTKTVLVERLTALIDEYVTQALEALAAGQLEGWAARLRVRVLRKMELPLPEEWLEYGQAFVQVQYTDKSGFTLLHGGAVTTRITVDKDTTLWIDDTARDLKGYNLSADDYVIRSKTKTADEVRTALDAVLAASKLTGVKIDLLSNHDWQEWRVPKKRTSNPKHRARMFKLVPESSYSAPYSDYWEPVTREPESTDVWVPITAFKPNNRHRWFNIYNEAKRIATAMNLDMPVVYGYKHTDAKPVDASKITGKEWNVWHRETLDAALAMFSDRIEDYHWAYRNGTWEQPYRAFGEAKAKDADRLAAVLGEQHPIVVTIRRVLAAKESMVGLQLVIQALFDAGYRGEGWDGSEAKKKIAAVIKPYKLFRSNLSGLHTMLTGEHGIEAQAWLEYVELLDAKHGRSHIAAPANPPTLKIVP